MEGNGRYLPECLDDFIDEGNPVCVIDVFVEALDLAEMGFAGIELAATGRPSYHPSVLLKLYIYDYLNRVQSSRRLERVAGRNVEVMWLLGRLAPDHKTIADFRKDNGLALRKVCARFVELCREMGLLATSSVAIDGSKFKAVNNRDKNFTKAKVQRLRAQLEESVARYLSKLDTADQQEPTEALYPQTVTSNEGRWLRPMSLLKTVVLERVGFLIIGKDSSVRYGKGGPAVSRAFVHQGILLGLNYSATRGIRSFHNRVLMLAF